MGQNRRTVVFQAAENASVGVENGFVALIAGSDPSAEPYLKVGTLQASHTSPTSDGTKAARYTSIRKFIAPVSISGFSTEDRDVMLSGSF